MHKLLYEARAPPFEFEKIEHSNISKSNGGIFLKIINLKDYYPYYKEDSFIEVSDEIAEQLESDNHADEAYRIRTLRHKAYYSLDLGDQIEKATITNHAPSADDVYEHQENLRMLRNVFDDVGQKEAKGVLTEKQMRRLSMFYYDGMSFTDIAAEENCDWSSVRDTIERGMKRLREYFEKN